MSVMLTAPVDDAGELTLRAQSFCARPDGSSRCEGEADVVAAQAILRVGTVVK